MSSNLIPAVERVSYKQVYDLVFRSKNAKLNSVAFSLDYLDWVKAGVAFNTRGFHLSSRKISYFAELYGKLSEIAHVVDSVGYIPEERKDLYRKILGESLPLFYEDIYEIYQDHLRSINEATGAMKTKQGSLPDYGQLLVLPSFDEVPFMRDLFETVVIPWNNYMSDSKYDFEQNVASSYIMAEKYVGLYSCMLTMYDYGAKGKGSDILLEVTLWE